MPNSAITTTLETQERGLLDEWMKAQLSADVMRRDSIKESELREESRRFLTALRDATANGNVTDIRSSEWSTVKEMLAQLSRNRGLQGFTPSETATFVLSLKQPIFRRLREQQKNPEALADELWTLTALIDKLALYTTEVYQQSREEIIRRQTEEMLELSTPVVTLWDGILALPMIGTLDSARTQVVMESLLQRIVETGSEIAIIDITGVPAVDTLVAQHLLKTVAAARLMGADCIISGIRPQIAQTMVHLAVDLSDVTTKATLADAFSVALERLRKPTSLAPQPNGTRALHTSGRSGIAARRHP
jgi:rsbT co-antagonist protein RsbR